MRIIAFLVSSCIALTNYHISNALYLNFVDKIQHIGVSILTTVFIMLFIGHGAIYRLALKTRGLPSRKEVWFSSLVFPFLLVFTIDPNSYSLVALIPSLIASLALVLYDKSIIKFFIYYKHPYYENVNVDGSISNRSLKKLKVQFWSMVLGAPVIMCLIRIYWN